MKSFALAAVALLSVIPGAQAEGEAYRAMVERHAAAQGVPPELVHRVIMRESRYNPRAVHAGNYGMMQIKLQTARGLGYTGTAQGLLDPETNLTYAVKYLAGAYRTAGGNHDRAVSYYAGGYYYAAKRQRLRQANATMTASTEAMPLDLTPVFETKPVRRRHHRR
ncbi:lytic transglycosylase, catalytic [Afipia carboxidovorans OM5]|uniref:Putative transglycosylase n=1 Tax=Afipia carboxidovorans (strain ATCC 49405 / DSM 1227 / KCTC 32145 / OM5) TaxID=504832 RepID=B6JCE1_AFIC5|nr:transglycosylase SLT domain-containing protein [Afipia carboxidovorans]ACI92357.1 lytic transglycosylase, catalytic [Afipia carboxidovorans OM5]AEI03860.1 putative transglycosylase [Afipia carboxidovorans OM4]AEI07437.1 putative transglycosylase [Afipia carboxidovorans OM5]BEV44971.1 lytic transglycosylase domain-containing protein [Afipia carboxidovorans]